MLRYSILENPPHYFWDSFLADNSLGNLWQTIDYGKFVRRLYPYMRITRLIVTRDEVTEGIVQCIFSKFLGFGTVMSVREGPILNVRSMDSSGLLKSIISALEEIGVRNRLMRIRIQWPSKWGYVDLFRNMGYEHVGTKTTYTIDLTNGSADLWRRVCSNKRRNIRKACARGVEFVETSSFEDIEEFYDMVLDLAARNKSVPTPLSWFRAIWSSQSQKESSKLFFAKLKKKSLSGVFAIIHAKTIYALGWGYHSADLEVRPNDFLHWKIMEWGCNHGFLKYYMGEVHLEKCSPQWGTWRWKREWNGDVNAEYVLRKSISKYPIVESLYGKLKGWESDSR